MRWFIFWLVKYGAALAAWYGIDDRLAAHFAQPAIGSIPFAIAMMIILFISLSSEQYSVVRAYEVGRS